MMIKKLLAWLPAILIMATIFALSSIPSTVMPLFGTWDTLVKKGGHVLGYGLLAVSYWYGLGFKKRHWLAAFLLALAYALSDEFHQSFVPGRHPSLVDALVIDAGGAAIGLGLAYWRRVKTGLIKNE
jgi:VanZ family protein